MSICIKIDIREDDIWKELESWGITNPSKDGWYVERVALDVGDIAFFDSNDISGNPLVTLERKTVEDLASSQKDGRYREQRARLYALRGKNTSIGYIIEAPTWSPSLNRAWGYNRSFTELDLQHHIIRLQLRHTIPVLQSSGIRETIQWIRRIGQALHKDKTVYSNGMAKTCSEAAEVYKDTIHVKKADNNSPERIFLSIVLSIPGLGKASAEAIATYTNSSFTKLLSMTEEQIQGIVSGKKKIGSKVASSVFKALHT